MLRKKLVIMAAVILLQPNAFACSKITHNFGNNQIYTAHTFDFCMDTPVDIVVSPRGMQESGEVATGKNLMWTSKYASIMVREHFGDYSASPLGINQKGLGVHLLYLSSAQFPPYNSKQAGVSLFKFSKYILDNYASVAEVVKNIQHIQIVNFPITLHGMKVAFPAHFAFEDATGDSAVIEYIDGKLKIYHGKQYSVMTNEPRYDLQLANLAKYQRESSLYTANNLPGGAYSANRFIRAYYYNANLPTKPDRTRTPVAYMFSLINGVSSPYYANYSQNCGFDASGIASEDTWPTKWSAVLDNKNAILYFHNNSGESTLTVKLNDYDLNRGKAIVIN